MPELEQFIVANNDAFRGPRVRSLYADIARQKTINPSGYNASVSTWISALSQAAFAGELPLPSTPLTLDLSDALLDGLANAEHGRPLDLGTVIDEGVKTGKLITVSDFHMAQNSVYARGWMPSPWSMLGWGLRVLGYSRQREFSVRGELRPGVMVLMANLEVVASEMLRRQQTQARTLTDRVMSWGTFGSELNQCPGFVHCYPTDQDIKIVLKFLHREKSAITYNSKAIKFHPPGTPFSPITSQDETIASLKALITTLTSQCADLTQRITNYTTTISTALKTSTRTTALSALRARKRAERTLTDRTATLDQLETVFDALQRAADQVEIVRTMEASTATLKGLNKQIGDVDKVEDVLDQLREQVGNVNEVSRVLEEPVGDQVEEDEVEAELERLESEQRAEQQMSQEEKDQREADAVRKRLDALGVGSQTAVDAGKKRKLDKQREGEDSTRQQQDAVPVSQVDT